MKKIQFIIALVIQVLFVEKGGAQTSPYDHFMIMWYDYANISTSDNTIMQRYKDMKAMNFNCAVMDFRLARLTEPINPQYFQWTSLNPSKVFMDNAYTNGIKILLTTPENCFIRGADFQSGWFANIYNSDSSQQGLNYWGNHPALWGFYVIDEIYGYDEFHWISPYVNDIQTFNSNLLCFANFPYACSPVNISTYGQLIQHYIDTIHPNILSFDYYPFPYSPDKMDLFYHLDIMSRKSVENNIPFVYVLSSVKYENGWIELPKYVSSYCMYAGLCYGAKGLGHWNSGKYPSTFVTEHKEFIKNLNKKILDNEDILLSLQFKSIYHKNFTSTIGIGNDSIPVQSKWQYFSLDTYAKEIFDVNNPLSAMQGSTIDSLAISFMVDATTSERYFWVFNKSLVSSEDVRLYLKYGNGIIDVLDDAPCLPQNTVIHLEPAEAKLFKLVHPTTPITYTVTKNTTWKNKRVIYDNVSIAPSVTLTITDSVLFGANISLTVQGGGKLVIDGGILTNACEEELWWGVTAFSQSNIVLKNNARIENAIFGVHMQIPSSALNGLSPYGILHADNAHFINNQYAVLFTPVERFNLSHILYNNGSYFKNCTFTLNNNAYFPHAGTTQVELQGVSDISFTNCIFEDNRTNAYTTGIYANSSSIKVGNPANHILPPNSGCTFSGFDKAIYLKNSNSSQIYSTTFADNYMGILAEGAQDFRVENCQFEIPLLYPIFEESIGVYLKKTSLYSVENNIFTGETANRTLGVVTENTSEMNNFIRSNTFENLCIGVQAVGNNGNGEESVSDKSQGVVYQCNKFENNGNDIFVAENSRIRFLQSGIKDITRATGNVFFNTNDYNISYYESNYRLNYQYLLPITSSHYPSHTDNPHSKIIMPMSGKNSDYCCKSHGYAGNNYYMVECAPLSDLNLLNNKYIAAKDVYDAKTTNPRDGGVGGGSDSTNLRIDWSDPIVMNIVEQLEMLDNDEFTITIGGRIPITDLEKKIVLYYELSNLKQYMDIACYSALEILASNEEGLDMQQYILWVSRFNTVESDYFLADIYMNLGNFIQAENILNLMPSRFRELDTIVHQNYMDYFAVVQQYTALEEEDTIPSYLITELVRLFSYEDIVSTKAYSLGERLFADWREVYPRDFEIHPSCVCSDGTLPQGISGNNNFDENEENPLKNLDKKAEITLKPNPTTCELQVISYELQVSEIQIYSVTGQLLYQINKSTNNQINNEISIDISHLENGIYFVKISTEDGSQYVKKVVKN